LGSSGSGTTANIVVTYNANFFFNVMAVAFDNVDQTTPVSGAITGFAATLSVTSRTGDCAIDAIIGSGSGVAISSGQTITAKNDNLVFGGDPDSGFSASPGAASVAMNWSGFTSAIGHVGLNVRQLATPISVTTTSLVGASVGSTYLDVVSATGGIGAKTFTVTAGALPNGVTLQSGGTLTGTPTTTGTFNFTSRRPTPRSPREQKRFRS
jgi:hypothetical protein